MASERNFSSISNNSPSSSSSEQFSRKKTYLIRKHIWLILHALKCPRRICGYANCQYMKSVLTHLENCSLENTCQTPNCYLTKQHLGHWKNCTDLDCPACEPIRSRLSLQYQDGGASINADSNAPSVSCSVSGDHPKDWRLEVSTDIRLLFAYKLMHDSFSYRYSVVFDDGIENLLNYCLTVECEIFYNAMIRQEYEDMICEKANNLRSEFQQMNFGSCETNIPAFMESE